MRNEEANPFGGDGDFNPFGEEGLGVASDSPPSLASPPPQVPAPPPSAGDKPIPIAPGGLPLPSSSDPQIPQQAEPAFDPFSPGAGEVPSLAPSSAPPSFDDAGPPPAMGPPAFGDPGSSEEQGFPLFDAAGPPTVEIPDLMAIPDLEPSPLAPLPDTASNEVVAVAEVVGKSLDTVSEWMETSEILAVEEIAESIDDSEAVISESDTVPVAAEESEVEVSSIEPIMEDEDEAAFEEPTLDFDAEEEPGDLGDPDIIEIDAEVGDGEFSLDSDFPGMEDSLEQDSSDISLPEPTDDSSDFDLNFQGDELAEEEDIEEVPEFDLGSSDEETPPVSMEEGSSEFSEEEDLEDVLDFNEEQEGEQLSPEIQEPESQTEEEDVLSLDETTDFELPLDDIHDSPTGVAQEEPALEFDEIESAPQEAVAGEFEDSLSLEDYSEESLDFDPVIEEEPPTPEMEAQDDAQEAVAGGFEDTLSLEDYSEESLDFDPGIEEEAPTLELEGRDDTQEAVAGGFEDTLSVEDYSEESLDFDPGIEEEVPSLEMEGQDDAQEEVGGGFEDSLSLEDYSEESLEIDPDLEMVDQSFEIDAADPLAGQETEGVGDIPAPMEQAYDELLDFDSVGGQEDGLQEEGTGRTDDEIEISLDASPGDLAGIDLGIEGEESALEVQDAEPQPVEEAIDADSSLEELSTDLSGFDLDLGGEEDSLEEESTQSLVDDDSSTELESSDRDGSEISQDDTQEDLSAIDFGFDTEEEPLEYESQQEASEVEEQPSDEAIEIQEAFDESEGIEISDFGGIDLSAGLELDDNGEPKEESVLKATEKKDEGESNFIPELKEKEEEDSESPDDFDLSSLEGGIDLESDHEEDRETSSTSPDEIDLGGDFASQTPDDDTQSLDPFTSTLEEEVPEDEKDLAQFIEQEQLIEKMEERNKEFEVSEPAAGLPLKVADTTELIPVDQLDVPLDSSSEKSRTESTPQQHSLPAGLLSALEESAYLLEDGFVQPSVEMVKTSDGPLESVQTPKNLHAPETFIGTKRQSPESLTAESFNVGDWDTYLSRNSGDFRDLKKKLSTVFLENKDLLPDLMGYCEYTGLDGKNSASTYVLSEIHKEIGESLAVISLKMECLSQLENQPANELLICLELREYLPLDEDMVGRIAKLYRELNLLEEREGFLVSVLAQYQDFSRLDLAQKLFEHGCSEGLQSRNFLSVGAEIYRSLDQHVRVLELLKQIEEKYGLESNLVLMRAEILEAQGSLEAALEQYKQGLSQTEEPVKTMERIVLLLQRMKRVDQLSGFLNQLLSLDPDNVVGQGISLSLKEGSGGSPSSSQFDVGRLERRIEELLDSKLATLMRGGVRGSLATPGAGGYATPTERVVPPVHQSLDPGIQDPFHKDLTRAVEELPVIEPAIQTEFVPPTSMVNNHSTQGLGSNASQIGETLDQSGILRFLKDAQEKLSVPSKLSLEEAQSLKEEALKHAQNLKDPVLGFFWASELSRL